ncbi:hypothetical protein HQ531_00995 [bacterium]|nr:hypothetical protein [bacterium]
MKTFLFSLLIIYSALAYAQESTSSPIPSSSRDIEALSVGDTLPHVILTDTKHNTIDLYKYLNTQPIILIYYRGGW